MKVIHLLCLLFITVIAEATSPVKALLERIDKGASDNFLSNRSILRSISSNWIRKETKSLSVEIIR